MKMAGRTLHFVPSVEQQQSIPPCYRNSLLFIHTQTNNQPQLLMLWISIFRIHRLWRSGKSWHSCFLCDAQDLCNSSIWWAVKLNWFKKKSHSLIVRFRNIEKNLTRKPKINSQLTSSNLTGVGKAPEDEEAEKHHERNEMNQLLRQSRLQILLLPAGGIPLVERKISSLLDLPLGRRKRHQSGLRCLRQLHRARGSCLSLHRWERERESRTKRLEERELQKQNYSSQFC